MGVGMAPGRLQRVMFHTRDAEEARAFLCARDFRLEIAAPEAAHFDMRLSGMFLPNLYCGYLEYGAAAEIRADPSFEGYRFATPLRGGLAAIVGAEEIACRPKRGFLLSPMQGGRVRSERGNLGLNMMLGGPALHRHLAALLGQPPTAPLEFTAAIDVGGGYGRGLVSHAHAALADLDQPGGLPHPIAAGLFEQFLMVGLLLAHPHNYSQALSRGQHWMSPRTVKRAIDYIEANLDTPIGLAEIVAASGVPGRTLAQHFRRFRGTTPMRYLRRARLDKVHAALQRAEPEDEVTPIAMNWGFAHMGRFSAEYRRRFGEAPSQTLGKRPPFLDDSTDRSLS